jgi:hypothetical protein
MRVHSALQYNSFRAQCLEPDRSVLTRPEDSIMVAVKKRWMAAFVVAAMMGGLQAGRAQGPPPRPDAYDAQNWQAPRGYDEFYHENGTPNMVARQGYAAGFTQGESDFSRRRTFAPRHARFYTHVPSSPKGFDRDTFVSTYREAFEHGYTSGYNK